jgi:hypothetical protein
MNQFQSWLSEAVSGDGEKPHGAQAAQKGSPGHGAGAYLSRRGLDEEDDNAAERTANLVSSSLLDHRLTESEKKAFGTVVHYTFGVTTGAIYGLSTELSSKCAAGFGVPYGAAIWLFADEGLVPALGLSRLPHKYPLKQHAIALTSHLVYGLSADVARRVIRAAL